MNRNKELNKLIKKYNLIFVRRNKHLVYKLPNNKSIFISGTPSDSNSMRSIEQDIKRKLLN